MNTVINTDSYSHKIIVAPSILSADFANLERDIKKIETAGADWVHIDVMDGSFVPNITIGAPVVKSIRKATTMPFDVHLMIINPEKYIEDFAKAGANYITVHYEACKGNIDSIVDFIHSFGIKAGISIKPGTSVEMIEPALKKLDLILIMTVEPGFGGQAFMENCLSKISLAREILDRENLHDVIIEVDGGINDKTAKLCLQAGANALVAGSFIYSAPDISMAVRSLKNNF